MIYKFTEGLVATVWVNQVMYPGVVTSVDTKQDVLELDSIQHKGLKYFVSLSSITAVTVDQNADTMEKLEAARKEQEERNRAAAEEYRKLAQEEQVAS